MLRKYGISVDLNLYSVFDQLPEGITIQDKAGKLVYANTRAAILVGFNSPQEFLTAPIEEVLANFSLMDQSGKPMSLVSLPGRKVLETHQPAQATVRFLVKATGTESWALVKSQPLYDANKEVTGIINIFDDLTSIKKTEHEYKLLAQMSAVMAESFSYEARLERVAELAVPAIADWCVIDILDINGVANRVAAVHSDPEKVLLSKKLWTHYPPDPKLATGFYQLLKKSEIQLYPKITDDMLVTTTQDSQQLAWWRALNLQSAAVLPLIARGKKLGLLSFGMAESGRRLTQADLPFLQKLTERVALLSDNARLYAALSREMEKQKIIKNELQKTEEKFESIFHTSLVGMIIFDTEGYITEVNSAVCDLLQHREKNLIGQKLSEIISPANPKNFDDQWQHLLPDVQKDGELEWVGENQDRKVFEYTLTAQIVPRLNLLVIRDITDRRIEERRREHFLGITSHELKSPLACIKGIAQLLKKHSNSPEPDPHTPIYLNQITQEVDTLTRLVNDLLDVTRIRQGKLEFIYEIVDFSTLLTEVIQEVAFTAKDWQIETRGLIKHEIITDRGRLTQVLRNLIGNAVKYAPDSKKIIISVEEKQKTYQIEVQDFGPGLARSEQQKIFGLYYRSSQKEHRSGKGLGVGLFISSEIIKQMGGNIGVRSKVGEGATFYFSLPYSPKKFTQRKYDSKRKNE